MTSEESLEFAAALIADARSVVVFTGAGVSAESGIPTYRTGTDGLWSAQNMQRFANPAGYRANLLEAYQWYRARAEGVASAQPNSAHVAIVELERVVPRMTLVTQNIDSLHQRAGSREVLELHGNLRCVRCDACSSRVPWTEAPADPCCTGCGGMLRPEVVMFGDLLPEQAYVAAHAAAESCDVLISVGTSSQVFPASGLPLAALVGGAWVIVVNPEIDGQPTHEQVLPLPGAAGQLMPDLVRRAAARKAARAHG